MSNDQGNSVVRQPTLLGTQLTGAMLQVDELVAAWRLFVKTIG